MGDGDYDIQTSSIQSAELLAKLGVTISQKRKSGHPVQTVIFL